jgi:fermentation-respiration switch protein FrsA (DUF1100 family)
MRAIDLNEIVRVLVGLMVAYGVIVLGAWVVQRKLVYRPDPTHVAPSKLGLERVNEVKLVRPDGVELIGWYRAAESGRRTVLYFHGNAGNLAARAARMDGYVGTGLGMFMISYRGYSGSTGAPSEQANVADAIAAFDWLVERGIAPGQIVIYGESLGSGVAVQVALARRPAGIVLDAPYTSIAALGQRHYPFLPVAWLATERYDTVGRIDDLKDVPVLIIHGERDDVTPVEMGRAVYAAANAPKKIETFPEAGHADHHVYGAFETVQAWIKALDNK